MLAPRSLTMNETNSTLAVPNMPAETAMTSPASFCSRAIWKMNRSSTRTTESLLGPVVSVPSGSVSQVNSLPDAFRWTWTLYAYDSPAWSVVV